MSRGILWFRNDLRLSDNASASKSFAECDEVLPLVVIDPRQHTAESSGQQRSGSFRRRFLCEAIRSLDEELRAKGSALHVVEGDPAVEIPRIALHWQAEAVHAQRLFDWEGAEQERHVAASIDLRLDEPSTLLHPDDLPFGLDELPRVFTTFRKEVEKRCMVRDPIPDPIVTAAPEGWGGLQVLNEALRHTSPESDPRASFRFHGSRGAGLDRMAHYCSSVERLGRYKQTRNGLLGADFSGRFSPWLATGGLGAREVYRAVKVFEAQHGANDSSYWMTFELMWRDFFQFNGANYGAELFTPGGMTRRKVSRSRDRVLFANWCEGRTGQPFIDANMRELRYTGWMSNRGRQNVASYLVHDLGLDWRLGASWFEHQLVDYDACSNWGNWQYVAGVGNDPREGRRFDPVRQARLYDPEGAFVRHWS